MVASSCTSIRTTKLSITYGWLCPSATHAQNAREARSAIRIMSTTLPTPRLMHVEPRLEQGGEWCGKSRKMRDKKRIDLMYIVLIAIDELAGTKPEGNFRRRKGKFTKSVATR